MAHLVWSPDLNTGIAEIDRQHQRIAQYINTLHDLRDSPDRPALTQVIADTVDYTESHFVFEERLLEQAGFDFIGPHKKVHELFIRRMTSIQTRFDAGEDVTEELHQLLSRWLFSHIRSEDQAYAPVVKKYLHRTDDTPRIKGSGKTQHIDYEKLFPDLEQRLPKKGWLARLFGR